MRCWLAMPCSESFDSSPPQMSLARRPPSQANRRSWTSSKSQMRGQQAGVPQETPRHSKDPMVAPRTFRAPHFFTTQRANSASKGLTLPEIVSGCHCKDRQILLT